MKNARVSPVYKTGEESDVSNYRPISVLTCFSKILERIMYNRLYEYLTKNDILYTKQFGFRSNHSTDHAVVSLVNDITNAINSDLYTIGVFIDLLKAFDTDTVDHDILLSKLEHYGIKDTALLWFKDYLNNRQQCVKLGTVMTSLKSITCGVPQGSILGPLLFLIYVNDLPNVSDILNLILFADDTNIFYSHKNIHNLYKILFIYILFITFFPL